MFSFRKLSVVLAFVLVFAFGAVAFAQTGTPTAEMGTNSVTVADQAVAGGAVVVQQVMASEAGFIVIHADNNGAPGAVVGSAPVTAGANDNVSVTIETANATNTLWAMLHRGTGTFNIEANPPVMDANGQVVMESFTVTGLQGAATATATADAATTPAATAEATVAATAAATSAAAAATPAATTAAAAAGAAATGTASPATLPTTGGNNSSMLVVLLLGLGGLSLLAGLGLNLARRSR